MVTFFGLKTASSIQIVWLHFVTHANIIFMFYQTNLEYELSFPSICPLPQPTKKRSVNKAKLS